MSVVRDTLRATGLFPAMENDLNHMTSPFKTMEKEVRAFGKNARCDSLALHLTKEPVDDRISLTELWITASPKKLR